MYTRCLPVLHANTKTEKGGNSSGDAVKASAENRDTTSAMYSGKRLSEIMRFGFPGENSCHSVNRPLACPSECSQSGGQNKKIFLHDN